MKKLSLFAGLGVAECEFPASTGPVDYALFAEGIPLGIYHGRGTKLQAYLDEFGFLLSCCMTGDQVLLGLTRSIAASCGVLS